MLIILYPYIKNDPEKFWQLASDCHGVNPARSEQHGVFGCILYIVCMPAAAKATAAVGRNVRQVFPVGRPRT